LTSLKPSKNSKPVKYHFAEKDGGVVQTAIGKLSFDDTRLIKNLAAVVDQVQKVKPPSVKGTYIKSIYVSTTMGPSVKIDLTTLQDLVKQLSA
jgi:large subunit ribosomal protein L1